MVTAESLQLRWKHCDMWRWGVTLWIWHTERCWCCWKLVSQHSQRVCKRREEFTVGGICEFWKLVPLSSYYISCCREDWRLLTAPLIAGLQFTNILRLDMQMALTSFHKTPNKRVMIIITWQTVWATSLFPLSRSNTNGMMHCEHGEHK